MKLFDTHAHLSDARFLEDREEVIKSCSDAGVLRIVDVGCDYNTFPTTVKLTEEHDGIFGALGIHPHYASSMTGSIMSELTELLNHEKIVALGEIGLDYHYNMSPREVQLECFENQLELALKLNVPVIFHIREAFGDFMNIIRRYRGTTINGVMHCYSGSLEIAEECIEMGMHIAFGGSVTFNNATKLAEVAKQLPLDRLVIETDCPYMTPVPHRGKRNDPTYIHIVAEKIAELKGISADEVALATYSNACKLFKLSEE